MATAEPRKRTRQRPPATTVIELTAAGQRPSRPRRTPKTIHLDGSVPGLPGSALLARLTEAAVEELSKVSLSDAAVMVSSLITGWPVPTRRAAHVVKHWALNTGLAICRRVVSSR